MEARPYGSPTVIAVDGRSVAEAQAIFKARPADPCGVTWNGNNLGLNLYQQLLAGTGGSGLNIAISLNQTETSDLIDVLSDFNMGKFAGFPHCK